MRISDWSSDVCSSDLIIGRAQAVPAGADNHDVIFGFRLGIRPLLLPALVAAHRLAKERSPGELRHGYTPEFMSVGSIGLPVYAGQKRKVKLTSCTAAEGGEGKK